MTNPDSRARRASIQLGNIEIEGFQLPDGSYRLSQTQTAKAVGLKQQNASDSLRSKAIKSLLGKGYTAQISTVEIDSEQQISYPLTQVIAMAEKKKKVSVYLDSETLEEVEQEATDQERSISFVISKMVEEQLRQRKEEEQSDDK